VVGVSCVDGPAVASGLWPLLLALQCKQGGLLNSQLWTGTWIQNPVLSLSISGGRIGSQFMDRM